MKVIHIDAENREVKEVEIRDDENGSLEDIIRIIKGHFSALHVFDNGDVMYAFDEMDHPPNGFSFSGGGYQDYYPGNALILGPNGPIEVSCKSSLAEIQALVKFHSGSWQRLRKDEL